MVRAQPYSYVMPPQPLSVHEARLRLALHRVMSRRVASSRRLRALIACSTPEVRAAALRFCA